MISVFNDLLCQINPLGCLMDFTQDFTQLIDKGELILIVALVALVCLDCPLIAGET